MSDRFFKNLVFMVSPIKYGVFKNYRKKIPKKSNLVRRNGEILDKNRSMFYNQSHEEF